jgi:hypothetical protein
MQSPGVLTSFSKKGKNEGQGTELVEPYGDTGDGSELEEAPLSIRNRRRDVSVSSSSDGSEHDSSTRAS